MFPYEQLKVYQKAFRFNSLVYRHVGKNRRIESFIRSQLGRASLSIMLNIAEGSAKVSNKDRKNFFITSRGSTLECFALLSFLQEENLIDSGLKEELFLNLDEISRLLFAMIRNLE